jgi:hypothetical protein
MSSWLTSEAAQLNISLTTMVTEMNHFSMSPSTRMTFAFKLA